MGLQELELPLPACGALPSPRTCHSTHGPSVLLAPKRMASGGVALVLGQAVVRLCHVNLLEIKATMDSKKKSRIKC